MKWRVWLFALVLLGGCAGMPGERAVDDVEQSWRAHAAALEPIDRWHLSGRLAVQTEEQGWHARLDWAQQADDYRIRIVGPLGQGAVYLDGSAQQVLLRSGNVEQISTDPEQLLREETGWQVPVAHLRYWVLGLPAPGTAAQRELTPQGRLQRLRQGGWEIEFSDYRPIGTVTLPGKVFAASAEGKVRLVIDTWELRGDV